MAHMSYDLAVYVPAVLTRKELASLATRPRGFRVDSKNTANLWVERERAYSFTVDGPFEIDADDDYVPEPVRALDFEPRYLYSVLVEGTTESEIPWATAFAQSLAGTLNGAAIDVQTEEVWARTSLQYRVNVAEPVQERIRLVEVAWICFAADVDESTVRRYLEIAGRLVPGAVPRRYGEYEPFQGSIDRDGVEGFLAAWRGATSTVFFHGSSPVTLGALDAPSPRGGRFWRITLDLRESLVSESWLSQLKELFGAVADELPAVYAQAAVTGGHVWDGHTVASDSQTDRLAHVGGLEWEGLSPDHPWLTWLGAPFAEYYAPLPADRVTRTERGVVYADAEVPTLSSELAGLQAWLPAELFATYGPKPEEAWARRPTIAASVVPPLLRGEGATS